MKNFLLVSALISSLSGCITLSGNYEIQAYDTNGTRLQIPKVSAQGSGIYKIKNALCSIYPNAVIKVINLDNNTELKNELRYCLKNTKDTVIPSTSIPQHFIFANQNFDLAHQDEKNNQNLYEYTLKGEKINHWNTLLTIQIMKNTQLSPQAWYASQLATLNKMNNYQDPEFLLDQNTSYFSVTFLPSNLNSEIPIQAMYEANVQKTFYECNHLITLSIAKRFKPSVKNLQSKIKQSRQEMLQQLQKEPWKPSCSL